MSDNWKKRVSDFFFEEIEMEESIREEKQSDHPVERIYPTQKQSVNTRVAYQYAKNKQSNFRFPVIPDEEQQPLTGERQDNLRPIRKNRRRRRMPKKNFQVSDDLENIPAYMRRNTKRESSKIKQSESEQENNQKTEEVQPFEKGKDPLEGYTRPEELDRVFRIRDGYDIQNKKATHPEKIMDEIEPSYTKMKNNSQPISEIEPITDEKNIPKEDSKEIIPPKEPQNISTTPLESMTMDNDLAIEESFTKSDVPNHLLDDPVVADEQDKPWLEEQQYLLNQTLEHFNINASVVNVTQGPSVTRFEIQPALGVKVSRIRGLADDIKLNMAARDIRMEAPIPGKHTIGIEVPNEYPQTVSLQEIIESSSFEQSNSDLTIALGLTIEGEPLITTIDKMPHGLIAGATGSGKSVCINSIILSMMYKSSHEDVKFLMIDPKMVELTPYNGIPHLISPVITDAKAATMALKWAVNEMEARYEKLAEARVRNIERYNEKVKKGQFNSEKLPYIVIIIDELADLMMVSPQEVEEAVSRIAQKARACGIHLLLATQRPSVDVITGLIKANIPTRIAFSVSSQVDSRTILDTNGAEKLLGKGDMLFIENGASKSIRLQGPFVSDEEIDRVANYARQIAEPNYLFEQEQLLLEIENENEDELLEEVMSFVVNNGEASTSLLQRRFRIGYNRAARLIDSLEQKGIISTANGSKPRDVLISQSQLEDIFE